MIKEEKVGGREGKKEKGRKRKGREKKRKEKEWKGRAVFLS